MALQRVRFLGRLKESFVLPASITELLGGGDSWAAPTPPSGTRGFAKALKQKLTVVLKEDIRGVGQAGEVVSVAAGYARNFLIPHQKALPGLEKYIQLAHTFRLDDNEEVQQRRAGEADADVQEKERLRIRREREKVVRRLTSTKVVFYRNLNKADRISLVYPIQAKDIVAEVARQLRVSMQEECIRLAQPINALGEFEVPLQLPQDEGAQELQEALLAESSGDTIDEDEEEGTRRELSLTVRVRRKGKTGTAKGVA